MNNLLGITFLVIAIAMPLDMIASGSDWLDNLTNSPESSVVQPGTF